MEGGSDPLALALVAAEKQTIMKEQAMRIHANEAKSGHNLQATHTFVGKPLDERNDECTCPTVAIRAAGADHTEGKCTRITETHAHALTLAAHNLSHLGCEQSLLLVLTLELVRRPSNWAVQGETPTAWKHPSCLATKNRN